MIKYVSVLLLIIKVTSASTLCTNITQSVSHVAFGNYLSFSASLFLSCFSKPSAEDKTFFAKVNRIYKFYLYCNEGYLSSVLLFLSGFILNNAIHMAYEWVFPSDIWKIVNIKTEGKKEEEDTINTTNAE
ncbi:25153_t:CDS:2 [Dentiscutata erythropus]|uniref:25153_t:CDS:1 n=1 Tax=Dentiscutata erythropus TaxID=1348616 RepID=A0A9N9B3G9_9GLOM|nr:25153_t:CDS:2 [Dentiscutata erythropus]